MTGFLDGRAGLPGKVAVLLGGGGGIGRSATLALAQAGVDVAICDVDRDALDATSAEVQAAGRQCLAMQADVTDPDALDAFYDAVAGRYDHVDIVVNIAGGVKRGAFMETSRTTAADQVRRNFGYVVQSVERAVPLIRASGAGGSIINFTTIEAHRGAAGFSVYAGAKAATANFTRSMAVELGAERIRLNCIAPDTTPSNGNMTALAPAAREAMAALPPEQQGAGLAMYIPMKAPPPPDALANAILFLASDLSAFVTGTTIHVDGGTMAAAGFLDWPFGDGFLPVPLAGTLGRLGRE